MARCGQAPMAPPVKRVALCSWGVVYNPSQTCWGPRKRAPSPIKNAGIALGRSVPCSQGRKQQVRCGYPQLHTRVGRRHGHAAGVPRNTQRQRYYRPGRDGRAGLQRRGQQRECATAETMVRAASTSLLSFRESFLMQISIWNVFWS